MIRPSRIERDASASHAAGLTRREFAGLLATAALCARTVHAATASAPSYAVLPSPPASPAPAGKRLPFGWPAFAVGAAPVTLGPPGAVPDGASALLRLTLAIDDREPRFVAVTLAGDSRLLGRLDLRFAHAIETFQLALTAADTAEVARRGVNLRLEGDGTPLWFFGGPPPGAGPGQIPVEYQPHLMTTPAGTDSWREFHRRFASLASVQAFGWMQGCVFEGLHALERRQPAGPYREARDAQWRLFVPVRDRLVYENPRSEPVDDRVYGIEGCLPYADLVRRDPSSPVVDRFVTFARGRERADGAIQDGGTLSAEGSYTIAYPLAVIADVRRERPLAELALRQLRLRNQRLWHEGAIWLRRMDDGRRTFRGWARGVAWHVLGVAQSIEPLRRHVEAKELEVELRRAADWLLPLQRSDGLWACFVEDRTGLPDTSGSAGIATALAVGARLGVLPRVAGDAARRALAGMRPHLTPDGLLGGVAQSNRGGEELQRSDYRVLAQMGMGLVAQLIAEIGDMP